MANRIFIQDHYNTGLIYSFPLTKDPMIEIESQFSSFGEVIPIVNDVLNTYNMVTAGMAGSVSIEQLAMKNLFDIKRWTKTEPLRFTVDLQLFTKTDSEKDVHDKANFIMNYVILSRKSPSDPFVIPGISLASLKDFQQNGLTSANAKIISVWIPGILYVPKAIIEKVQPTFSRELTEKGFPLWAELNVNIESVFPAISDFFDTANVQQGFLPGTLVGGNFRALGLLGATD